jgi:hypothetical protein
MRAAGVRNDPSHNARDGLGVRRPDQEDDGDRQSCAAQKTGVREFPPTGQQTPSGIAGHARRFSFSLVAYLMMT